MQSKRVEFIEMTTNAETQARKDDNIARGVGITISADVFNEAIDILDICISKNRKTLGDNA